MKYVARFGTVGEIFERTDCPSCNDLRKELKRWEEVYDWESEADQVIGIEISDPSGDPDKDAPQLYYLQATGYNAMQSTMVINIYVPDQLSPLDERGRLFDTHHIDIGIIKNWIHCCDETHGEACLQSMVTRLAPESMPPRLLLVDLAQECLVYGTLDDQYIALSYVWGQVDTLKTSTTNLLHLMQPGSLRIDSDEYPMPPTIRDFIRLAIQLGVRYVWVDTLCIVQDGADKQSHLQGMAAIYASAYLTVISHGSDASFGLIGIGSGATPRNRECRTLQLPDMSFPLIMDDNCVPPGKEDAWAKRAWTFQEGLFSRRMVTFDSEGLVSWKCQRHFWNEACEAPSEALGWAKKYPEEKAIDWRYLGMSQLNVKWPDMRRWCELMEEYHQRRLTFDSDAVSALAGLIAVANHTSYGGLFYGLPEYFFDIYMLWDLRVGEQYPMPEPGDVEWPMRRTSPEVPSWSFLGWKHGILDTHWWRMSMDHTFIDDLVNGFGSDISVQSIIAWKKREKESGRFIAISNLYHTDRALGRKGVCPPGWHREDNEGVGKWFRHDSLEYYNMFRYPVTLPSAAGATMSHDYWSHQLHFRTKRAWLKIGMTIRKTSNEHALFVGLKHVSLVDDAGRWAGAIRLPTNLNYDDDEDECEEEPDNEEDWEDVEESDDEDECEDEASNEQDQEDVEDSGEDRDDEEDVDRGSEDDDNESDDGGSDEEGDEEKEDDQDEADDNEAGEAGERARYEASSDWNEAIVAEDHARSLHLPQGSPVELIAIASGTVRNSSYPKMNGPYHRSYSISEWNCKARPTDREFYEFYFVLWIEWVEGIAYRKALGRVEKRAWESLALEDIDVILG
jgi:hypothetical protein